MRHHTPRYTGAIGIVSHTGQDVSGDLALGELIELGVVTRLGEIKIRKRKHTPHWVFKISRFGNTVAGFSVGQFQIAQPGQSLRRVWQIGGDDGCGCARQCLSNRKDLTTGASS